MRSPWKHHPAVRTGNELTLGERAADAMRNGMGSWTFVGGFLAFMAFWAILNVALLRDHGFDPYPFILLNLLLSTMAGLQAAALLIAAKRADAIDAEVAVHTERTADDIKEMMVEVRGMAQDIKKLLEANTALTQGVHKLAQSLHDHLMSEGASAAP